MGTGQWRLFPVCGTGSSVGGIQDIKEVIEEGRHGRHGRRGVLRGIIISERWMREKCHRVERTVNEKTCPACPVISADSLRTALSPPFHPAASTRRPPCSPSLSTDAISHTGSETARLQSHHDCEGNCSSLARKSASPCALLTKTYIYAASKQHTHTRTRAQTHTITRTYMKRQTDRILPATLPRQKSPDCVCCCPAFYIPLCM